MDYNQKALELHKEHHGKLEVRGKMPARTMEDLSVAYTPGVAAPCLKIKENPDAVYDYTMKGNLVAVISDGTAVLGLGDIGPKAAIPVMEGKSLLFKEFAGVDAIPVCLATKDTDELVRTIQLLEPTLGGINLEDIAAPRCFEIERRLQETMDIPVFHDDQHGTAIVVLSALLNALRLLNRGLADSRVVINGAGSAGIAIARLLMSAGVKDLTLVDRKGALCPGEDWMNPAQAQMAEISNPRKVRGTLTDALKDGHVFIGVSGPGALTGEMVKVMAPDPVIFAMANPVPEIMPDEAKAAGAAVVGTGRSDYPNQINNVLAFPGIFRGALDVRASCINEAMKVAAANAIASLVEADELSADHIIPSPFNPRLAARVAEYVARAALESGVARRTDITPETVYQNTMDRKK